MGGGGGAFEWLKFVCNCLGVRRILGLPYTTHAWMLGPQTKYAHIKYKLYIRDYW